MQLKHERWGLTQPQMADFPDIMIHH